MKRITTIFNAAVSVACALVFALLLTTMPGCAKSEGSFQNGDCKATLTGGVLTMEFEGNATTGYDWTAEISETASNAVELTQDEYKASESNGAVGTGGTHTFELKGTGKATGSVTVEFKYARSWESSDADKTATVELGFDASGNINSVKYSCNGVAGNIN